MRVPGSVRIQDTFVPSVPHASSSGGGGTTATNLPVPFEIQSTMDFDDTFDLTFGASVVGRYVVPYFASSAVRVVIAYQVVNDQNFTLQWLIGPYRLGQGESLGGGPAEFRTTLLVVNGVAGDERFVEWNITVDDKYPLRTIRDIEFILLWSNQESGTGDVKFLGPIYFLNGNTSRLGATAGGSPAVYEPLYFGN